MGRGWGVEELITFGLHCLMSAVATLKMLLCRVAAKLKMPVSTMTASLNFSVVY